LKDEPVDVLDEQGSKTGQVVMKKEAHDKGLWHPIVHLWIYNSKSEILLQKRSPDKIVHPNVWDVAVGGHVSAGETLMQAVLKETGEELGLTIPSTDIIFFERVKFEIEMLGGWWNRVFIWSYTAPLEVEASKIKFQKEEITAMRWIGIKDLEEELKGPKKTDFFSPDMRKFSKTALNEIRRRLK
jgi:isopentenyl-diphosphate Delta-isomerase